MDGVEKLLSDQLKPLLEPKSEQLAKMPNPMTIYLGEMLFILLTYLIYPSALKTLLLRILLVPLLVATTILYLLWSMNEVNRSELGLDSLAKKEKEILARSGVVDKNMKGVSKLNEEMETLLKQVNAEEKKN